MWARSFSRCFKISPVGICFGDVCDAQLRFRVKLNSVSVFSEAFVAFFRSVQYCLNFRVFNQRGSRIESSNIGPCIGFSAVK